MTDPPKQAA